MAARKRNKPVKKTARIKRRKKAAKKLRRGVGKKKILKKKKHKVLSKAKQGKASSKAHKSSKHRKPRKPTNYNIFVTALSKWLRENAVDYRQHGTFNHVASQLWKIAREHPLKQVLDNIDELYYGRYEPKIDRTDDKITIETEYADTEWWNFWDLHSFLMASGAIKEGDKIFFIGVDNCISTYDISDSNGAIILWEDLRLLFNPKPISPVPTIGLVDVYTIGNHLVTFYTLYMEADHMQTYCGRLGAVNVYTPDLQTLYTRQIIPPPVKEEEKPEVKPEEKAKIEEAEKKAAQAEAELKKAKREVEKVKKQLETEKEKTKQKKLDVQLEKQKEKTAKAETELAKVKAKERKDILKTIKDLKKEGLSMKEIKKLLGI